MCSVRGLPSEPVSRAGQEQAPATSTGGDQYERRRRGTCQSKSMLVPKQVREEGLREGKEMSGPVPEIGALASCKTQKTLGRGGPELSG